MEVVLAAGTAALPAQHSAGDIAVEGAAVQEILVEAAAGSGKHPAVVLSVAAAGTGPVLGIPAVPSQAADWEQQPGNFRTLVAAVAVIETTKAASWTDSLAVAAVASAALENSAGAAVAAGERTRPCRPNQECLRCPEEGHQGEAHSPQVSRLVDFATLVLETVVEEAENNLELARSFLDTNSAVAAAGHSQRRTRHHRTVVAVAAAGEAAAGQTAKTVAVQPALAVHSMTKRKVLVAGTAAVVRKVLAVQEAGHPWRDLAVAIAGHTCLLAA